MAVRLFGGSGKRWIEGSWGNKILSVCRFGMLLVGGGFSRVRKLLREDGDVELGCELIRGSCQKQVPRPDVLATQRSGSRGWAAE